MKIWRYKLLPPAPIILPALLSGVLLGLSFPPFSIPGVGFFALVPMLVAVFRKTYGYSEVFRTGFLFGLVFFLLLLWWVKNLLPWANVTIPWLMTPALIILVAYLALYPAFFLLLLRFASRGRWSAAFFIGPALWSVLEIVRSRGELGFPWGVVGYSLSYIPNSIQIAPYAGVFGVSFLIAAVNFVFSSSLLSKGAAKRLLFLVMGLSIIAANGLIGKVLINRFQKTEKFETIKVAAVQPNINLKVKWDPAFTDSIFSLHERLCRDVAKLEPDLYIFPETSAPVYLRYEPGYRKRLADIAREVHTPIFIGFLDAKRNPKDGRLDVFNAAGLFSKEGVLRAQYEKVHLLPFGEALPLSGKFRFLERINFGQANFQRGTLQSPIHIKETSFGALICFESIFPELCRYYARHGAGFFVNITNDGWFGDTPGPIQHAQMCIIRAVENRRSLVRSANSGISMIVDPLGEITDSIGLDKQGAIVNKIPLVKTMTFYTKHGEMPVMMASVIFALIGVALGRRRVVR